MSQVSEDDQMITTVTGTNQFQIGKFIRDTVDTFLASYDEFGLERLDAEELEATQLLESLQSIPLFSEKKLIIIDNASSNKAFCEKFPSFLSLIPESTDVFFVEKKIDKRSSFYKFLKKETDFKEMSELDPPALARWLVEQSTATGAILSLSDANYLVQRVGANQVMLYNELQKLVTFDKNITKQTIDKLTEQSPQGTIFELLDAVLNGRHKKAMELYDEQRRMKVEPQQVIAMLAWQLHILAIVKSGDSRLAANIASEARLSPFVVSKTQKLASGMSFQQIKKAINDLFELDLATKSSAIDADQALKHFIIAL